MVGMCRLCREKKKLCKKSHIIPNFMYQALFDEKNRIHLIKSEVGKIKQSGFRQSGEFDSHILCYSCDNETLGKLDHYASLVLYDGYPKISENREHRDGMKYRYCAGIDYSQFKLFLLSILFRASIGNRPLFNEVQLGPHEDRIRQMLLNGEPGEQLEYPCLMMTYLHLKEYPGDLVAQPSRARVNGGYVYKFLIGGIIYVFFISKCTIFPELKDIVVNTDGVIKVIHSPPSLARRALGSMVGINLE